MIIAETIPQLFVQRLKDSADRRAIQYFQNDRLVTHSWSDIAHDVQEVQKQIASFQFPRGSRIAHLSENRYEWIVVDLAIQFCGLVHVPIHQHLAVEQMALQLVHSDAVLAIISPNLSDKFARLEQYLQDFAQSTANGRFPSLKVEKSGKNRKTSNLEKLVEQLPVDEISSGDLVSIMYTSGTTGEPNGVMLTQANIISNIEGKLDAIPLFADDVRLAFLPMTHIFSRTCDIYTWIAAGCNLVISQGREHVIDECAIVSPTYINAVPFFYHRCYEIASGKRGDTGVTDLKKLLGGKIRICNCGGAAIADEVFDFFHQCGVMLVTGYGLTETSPVLTSNRPMKVKKGTVGPALENVELRIKSDGELLARGPNVFKGYWKAPESSAAAFEDGWFCTGDLAAVDGDGYISIIGRKKEMIVTSGGFNIFPSPIEEQLLRSSSVEQCLVIGDRRDYLIALVVVSNAMDQIPHDDFRTQLMLEFEKLLSGFSKYERIGNVMFVEEPFSIENGLLTPKMSLRRGEIEKRYAKQIEAIYSSAYNSGKTSCERP